MEATVRRPLAALILAAGVSSRMERFKPMLPVGEDTMIRRTVRMIRSTELWIRSTELCNFREK